MLYSMTGAVGSSFLVKDNLYQVDIVSLNSRYFEIRQYLPPILKSMEVEWGKLLQEKLIRGRISLTVKCSISASGMSRTYDINKLQEIKDLLEGMALRLNIPSSLSLEFILSKYDCLTSGVSEETDEEAMKAITCRINDLTVNLWQKRRQEGEDLQNDIVLLVKEIEGMLSSIEEAAPARLNTQRSKLQRQVKELTQTEMSSERLEQEIILYAEKWDIHEEIIRMISHIKHFSILVLKAEQKAKGKELGFFAQEMLREINTICSKASDKDIISLAVGIKTRIDKLREQIENIV